METNIIVGLLESDKGGTLPWIELSAVFIALCALIVSVYVGYIQRKHNILSSKPHINVNKNSSPSELSFSISSNGIGPAYVNRIVYKITTDRAINTTSTQNILSFILLRLGATEIGMSRVSSFELESEKDNCCLAVGECKTLIKINLQAKYLEGKNEVDIYNAFQEIKKDIRVTISYADVYGNEFKAN